MAVMDQGCDLCRVKKFSVVSSTGFGKFQMFLHPKPPQKDVSVHSVPVLLGLVAWQLPLCLCSHHPARVLHSPHCAGSHKHRCGVVPYRCGGHNTTQICGVTPAILAVPRIKSGSKPSFLSAQNWVVAHSWILWFSILVESVLPLSV